jgi:hypothetical protein
VGSNPTPSATALNPAQQAVGRAPTPASAFRHRASVGVTRWPVSVPVSVTVSVRAGEDNESTWPPLEAEGVYAPTFISAHAEVVRPGPPPQDQRQNLKPGHSLFPASAEPCRFRLRASALLNFRGRPALKLKEPLQDDRVALGQGVRARGPGSRRTVCCREAPPRFLSRTRDGPVGGRAQPAACSLGAAGPSHLDGWRREILFAAAKQRTRRSSSMGPAVPVVFPL